MDAIEKEYLPLYDICCSIGLSSSQWKRNIQYADCIRTLMNIHPTNYPHDARIICGSESEGIRLFRKISAHLGTSSDVDCIYILGGINVQEHVHTKNTNQAEILQLLYTDSPEQVLLEVKSYERKYETFNTISLYWIPYVIKKKDNTCKYLVSSSSLKVYFKDIFMNTSFSPNIPVSIFNNVQDFAFPMSPTIHGPAITTVHAHPFADSISFDVVCGLRCYEWPTAAHEWIDRARPHGWPSQDMIDQIMCDGCELVPIGRQNHPDGDEEWKLSFSRAETYLIRHFNIYQAQCYQLLKIVKHHCISSVVVDSLSSYHIKTVMLHTVEQTDPKVWRNDNLPQCFEMCLSNLKRYLTDKFLPQYFIVKHNLWEPKVTGEIHQKVLEIVTDLNKIGWKCILQFSPLQDLYLSIKETVDSIPYKTDTDLFSLEGNTELIANLCSKLLLNVLIQGHPVSYNCYLLTSVGLCEKTFLKSTSIHPNVEIARVLQLLRKSELGFLLTVIRAMTKPELRPGINPLMIFARQCLEESCHADVSSCRLKLATFYFHLGDYNRCIATVQDVLERLKDVWIVVGGIFAKTDNILFNSYTSELEFRLNRVLQMSDNGFPFISNHMSLPAFFARWEVAVAPKGIQFLNRKMPRRNGLINAICCIDSIVYAHYLLLESYLKIHEYDLSDSALMNMKESIRNRKDDRLDRNGLCFCEEDNLLLQYSVRLMTVAKNVKDK